MAARQPTIVATSIGFQLEGPDPTNLRPGPSYRMAADLAQAGEHPRVCILATDHPLTTFPQVVLTPHIGGATYDTESNHTRTIAEDLCRLMAGARPLHIVNPEVLAG